MNGPLLDSAPQNLLEKNFGRFAGIVANQDLAMYENNFIHRRLHRKAWVFGGSFSTEAFVGFAISDVGYAATAFCYYFDPKTSTFIEEKALRPFYFPKNFKPTITQNWHLKSGKREWNLESHANNWHFEFKGTRLQMSLQMEHSFEGISAIAPHRPFHYTYKLASLPVQARVCIDGIQTKTWTGSYGTFDFSLGFPDRKIFWNWAAFVGKTQDGAKIGINVVHPFNEGLENAMWVDGRLIALSHASFQYEKKDSFKSPWHIHTQDGFLTLDFYPEIEHTKNSNLLLLKSKFKQGIGHFSGVWKERDKVHTLTGSGVVEEHSALW